MGVETARPTETGSFILRFRGRDKVRSIRRVAALLLAALLAFPAGVLAQQAGKRTAAASRRRRRPSVAVPASTPAGRHAALTDKLNQNTVTVISGNPNGTYLYLAYDMSAVLDDGNDLRVLPIIGKGGYQNVMDVLLPAGRRPVHHAVQHHELSQEDRASSAPTSTRAWPTSPSSTTRRCTSSPDPASRASRISTARRVNFSDVGSGTQFSTRLIFELLGIKVQEVNVDQADGYQRVKSGEIAATILIAGKPTGSFGKFKLEPGMTLLPVPYTEALEQDYFPAKLTNDDYPNLDPQGQLRRHRRRRRRARRPTTGRATRTAIAASRCSSTPSSPSSPSSRSRRGTPSGRRPTSPPRCAAGSASPRRRSGWPRIPTGRPPPRPCQIDPAIVRAQAAKAAPNDPAEQERLFQQFMEWAKSQKR